MKKIKCSKCNQEIYCSEDTQIEKEEICYKCSSDYDQELKNDMQNN